MQSIDWKAPKSWVVVVLTTLLISLLDVQRAEACSCLPSTVESSYNNSTDVAMVRVNAGLRLGSTRWYVGTVQKPFKGCLSDGQPVIIRTAASSAECGTTFSVGNSYLINGQEDGSLFGVPMIRTGLCAYNRDVSALSEADLDFLFAREVCCGDECACADGSEPVACLVDPCQVAAECPDGECVSNYCGGCNAEFYDDFGYAVCEAAPGECSSDADCPADQWCRQAEPDAADPTAETYECVPFVAAGDSCNGFTLPWIFERCGDGLVCDPVEATGDLPGICRVPCAADSDCTAEEHCNADGLCALEEGTGCYSDAECAEGFACNAADVCLPPPDCGPDSDVCPTVCYGECIPVELAECATDADCIVTGCSSQVCANEDVATTCEWREEYACYADEYTSCGCQQGSCGWAQTPELEQCLADAGGSALQLSR